MAELESIVRELEASRMPLGDLVDHYERGTSLLDYCRGELAVARLRVETISLAAAPDAIAAAESTVDERAVEEAGSRSGTKKQARKGASGNSRVKEQDEENGRLL